MLLIERANNCGIDFNDVGLAIDFSLLHLTRVTTLGLKYICKHSSYVCSREFAVAPTAIIQNCYRLFTVQFYLFVFKCIVNSVIFSHSRSMARISKHVSIQNSTDSQRCYGRQHKYILPRMKIAFKFCVAEWKRCRIKCRTIWRQYARLKALAILFNIALWSK